MHVLLLSIAYPPEVRSASTLTYDFARGLRARGHKVTVVTGYPRYNLPAGTPEHFAAVTDEDGVRVIRVRTLPVHKVPIVQRGFGELALPYHFVTAALQYVDAPVDVIEMYSPPLTLGVAGWILKKRLGAPLVVNVQDLFPQNAVDLGIVKNPVVLAGLRALERTVYAGADAITVHSVGNGKYLVERRGQPEAKVKVIPNWVEPTAFDIPTGIVTNGFLQRYGLQGKFVLLFAGVLGPAQGLDVLIDAAHEVRDESSIAVLFVGDGMAKAKLMARCESRGQTNVRFEHFISKDEYPNLLAECHVGLVSITSSYHTPVVPGKLQGYMAGGVPVLAALNVESDGHQILTDSQAGLSVLGGDSRRLAENIRRLYSDPNLCAEMGARGRAYALEHFNKNHCVGLYERLFQELQ